MANNKGDIPNTPKVAPFDGEQEYTYPQTDGGDKTNIGNIPNTPKVAPLQGKAIGKGQRYTAPIEEDDNIPKTSMFSGRQEYYYPPTQGGDPNNIGLKPNRPKVAQLLGYAYGEAITSPEIPLPPTSGTDGWTYQGLVTITDGVTQMSPTSRMTIIPVVGATPEAEPLAPIFGTTDAVGKQYNLGYSVTLLGTNEALPVNVSNERGIEYGTFVFGRATLYLGYMIQFTLCDIGGTKLWVESFRNF